MSRSLRRATICSLAAAAVLFAANSSFASCGSGRYGGRQYRYPTNRAPIVNRDVRPVVQVARPVGSVAGPIVAPQPIQVAPQLPLVPVGSTLSIPGDFPGPVAGHVFLLLNDVKLPVKIVAWDATGVTIMLPPMAVERPSPAQIDVILPEGELASKVKILLTPPAPLVIHPAPPALPASPLPTGPAAPPVEAAAPPIGGPLVLNSQQ